MFDENMVLIIYMMFVFCSERKHPSNIIVYTDLMPARRRTLELEKKPKQAKISDLMAVGGTKRGQQAKVEKVLINFICEGLGLYPVLIQ